ncbi:MAG TPA: tRNA (5-methylaminomethyl-2-thiouridine)(34)-methyltransferase MnmD [Brevundimonas sp.]|uniref:tRNA (5-methylaminomethyl-2-thiouridine)(34)-methyltransferase MnmD n=1 Tax=Brevundimonas sp. TaxID=1871086 RepID=UPI002ED80922
MIDDRSPQLVWTDDGAPRSGRFDDVYFSREDGLAESRAVFLTGCGLPEAWKGRSRFTVAELGFGTGLNIAALLALWRAERPAGGRLHVFSVEGFPLRREEAARALAAWPELAGSASALLAAWPEPTPGFHRLDLPGFDAVVDVAVGNVESALARWSGHADAWFLDGFAPSTNPEMWSEAVLDAIVARSAPGARLATFTVAGSVRRGLAARGFTIQKRPGHGRKRERLEGVFPDHSPQTPDTPSIAIIGAGVAGAALARASAALGIEAVVVEAEGPGAGASGFPAALVTPRLDAGDEAIAALHAQALERAGALYAPVPNAVVTRGVLQLEQTARDGRRFGKVAVQAIWPEGAMTTLDADACSARLGERVGVGGLWMREALALRPAAVLSAWLGSARRATGQVARIARSDDGWRLLDREGRTIVSAQVVVIAAGWGTAALASLLPLAPVRGQADWVDDAEGPAAAWGGYVAPMGHGLLFGATHDRGESAGGPTTEASARNLATLAARMPTMAAGLSRRGDIRARTAVRATTPDRLPLAGGMGAAGLYLLGGLGSRGFCLAPLLAEHVVALAVGAPSPLPVDLASRVDPLRFNRTLVQPAAPTDD